MKAFGFDEAWNQSHCSWPSKAAALAARRSAVAEAFSEGIRRLGWTLIEGPASPPRVQCSRTFVLGVVLWSQYDLAALEDLASVAWIRDKHVPVEVFDIDAFPTRAELAVVLPGVPPISQTPLLAEYAGDRLVDYRVGKGVALWCQEFSRRDPHPFVAEVGPLTLSGGLSAPITPRHPAGS
jgi:hypothetical protein